MVKKTLLGQEVSWSDYTWDVTASTRAMSAAVAEDMQAAEERADEVADKAEANALVINNAVDEIASHMADTTLAVESAGSTVTSTAAKTTSSTKTATTAAEKLAAAIKAATQAVDNSQAAYSTLIDAVDEYNTYGQLSVDTAQALIALDDEYLALLKKEGDTLSIDKDAYKALITQQLENLKTTELGRENTEALTQALDLLTGSLDTTSESFTKSKTAAESWAQMLENVTSAAESGAVSTFEDLASALLSQDWESVAADIGQLLWGKLDDDTRQAIADWAVAAVKELNEGFETNGLAGLVETGASIVQSLAQGVSSNSGTLMAAAQSLFGDFSGIISSLTTAFPALSGVIEVASGAMGTLNAVMAANPILAVVSVIAMLVSALVGLSQTNTTVGKAIRGVWEGLKKVFDVVIDAILLAIGSLLQGWINMINAMIWAVNLIPGVNLDYLSNPAYDLLEKRQNASGSSSDEDDEDTSDKISDLNDQINATQAAYKTLSEAAAEYNKNGSISVDTAQAVSQLDSSYLALLQKNADGTLGVDETAYQKMLNAQIAALKAAMADGTGLTDALYTLTAAVQDQTDALTGSSLYDLDTTESSAINDYAALIAAARADALASGVRAASNYTSGSSGTTARLNASWNGESTTILEIDGREVARATADYMDEELSFS
jgi:superoxide dismutase